MTKQQQFLQQSPLLSRAELAWLRAALRVQDRLTPDERARMRAYAGAVRHDADTHQAFFAGLRVA